MVVLTGARQTGKTTLVRTLPSAPDRSFRSLDDLDVLERAREEPDLLVRESDRLTLDEVQRAPDLLRAIKRVVDDRRRAGQFLLTGSANLLLMNAVSETLAGRAVYLRLGPLGEREKSGQPAPAPWTALLEAASAEEAARVLRAVEPCPKRWRDAVLEGGLPPAVSLGPEDRARWFDGYVSTYLERDLQQLSSISDLSDFRRLLRLAAHRLGGLLNRAELARDGGLSRPTAHRWINLMEVSFQVRLLVPFSASRTKRLVKTPKLYLGDTGLAAHLAGIAQPEAFRALPNEGAWLEHLLLNHLDNWRETVSPRPELLFWRTPEGAEVDFVLEQGRTVLPIEVKTTSRARREDAASLERFLDQQRGARFGILVNDGAEVQLVSRRVVAAPVGRLL
ncbi:MAG: ATP-binding protein [Deltaproteobacteria bacterium]|nr:ATP-binding protein [Deltaproteobacteria bacterium]